MMQHEFERITGLEISYRDYNEIIEPMYNALPMDKFSFCEMIKPTAKVMAKKYADERKAEEMRNQPLVFVDRYPYDLLSCPGYAPRPTGYVVDSFAAALHCIYTTESFEAAVIKAVNLGGDADTIGAITGGLAGALYGYAAIPERWHGQLDATVRTNIDMLCAAAEAARMDA